MNTFTRPSDRVGPSRRVDRGPGPDRRLASVAAALLTLVDEPYAMVDRRLNPVSGSVLTAETRLLCFVTDGRPAWQLARGSGPSVRRPCPAPAIGGVSGR